MLVRCPCVKFTPTLTLVLAFASCTEKSERPRIPVVPAATVVVAPPTIASDAAVAATPDATRIDGDPSALAFLENGALAVATEKELVVADGAGPLRRVQLRGRTPKLDRDQGEGIVLDGAGDDVVLLETPTLRELYAGPGFAVMGSPHAIATTGAAPSVLLQHRGKLVRFELPPGRSKRVDSVDLSGSGRHAVVTWSLDDTIDAEAAVFDADAGRRIGAVRPMPVFATQPLATIAGDRQIAIDDRKVVVVDLATATVVRSANVACPKNAFLGNPKASADADLVLVTCGSDGIALEAKTLAPKRRYARIMPGCDNGEILPAHFEPNAKSELVVEGCGGIARLDLATGKYRCSDEIGLVGAEYEIVSPGPNGPMRQAPAGRENLPHCTPEDRAMHLRLGSSDTYWMVYGDEHGELVHRGGTIALDAGATLHTLSRDEKKIAYAVKGRVVVRTLPEGKVVQEIVSR